jgi:arylsulfatase A-like enzyme
MSRPNVVLVVVDTLRPDHLGCYRYGKNTSPHIDALAAESVVFDQAFAPGIPTMPSFTTLLTGLHPYRHGITAHNSERRLSERIQTLPQIARRAGYVTIGIDNLAVQGGGRGSWFARGFDFYSGFLYKPFSDQCEQVTDRGLRFVEDYRRQPFLLFLHLWDPHTPYGPPPPYDTMHYQPSPDDPKLSDIIALAPEYYTAFLADMKLRHPDDYAWVVAQYDGEISYADAQIGRVVAHLKQLNLWDDMILIVMSDHGECFGEGNVWFDHHGLYDAVMRVALLWHAPGLEAGRRQAMVSTEDILPTLIEACGWKGPRYRLTGQSVMPILGDAAQLGHEFIVGVESTRQASLCLRTEWYKLILPIVQDAQGNGLPDIYGRPRDPSVLLFDLHNDPGETRNIDDWERIKLGQRLLQWRRKEVARRHGDDPILHGLTLAYDDFMARLTGRGLRSG